MNKDRFEPDAATLISDDELLDALGRGERPAKDDTLTMAFALWRDEIVSPVARPQPVAKPKPGNKMRWGIISSIVAAVIGGGLSVATAKPGSPVWPFAEKVIPQDVVQSRQAAAVELRLVDAPTAVSEERLDLADRKLKEAEGLIAKITSMAELARLQAELAVVRDLLDTARARLGTLIPTLPPTPGGGGDPGLPIPTPAPTGDGLPLPTPTAPILPTPTSSPTRGPLLPLPSLPLPTIRLPLL